MALMRPGSRTDKLVWCPDIPTQRATLAETEAEQALAARAGRKVELALA